MVPTISALPATTEAGIRAKAAFVLHGASVDADRDQPDPVSSELLPAHSLAVDLLRPHPTLQLAGLPSTSDAALLALHDRFIDSQRRVQELSATIEDDDKCDAAKEPIYAEEWQIAQAADQLRATTLEGTGLGRRCSWRTIPRRSPRLPSLGSTCRTSCIGRSCATCSARR